MPNYQVLARKYRPQSFAEVLGQEAIVTTLKNAIKQKRLAHAYLFCGSRGTGKTTLARVFAKALNCQNPSQDGEPCNVCSSCKEITSGNSLDVLEIDGASHRGIDDIRQINETVGYASSQGKYKVYIIDEVHMLTKEAFNALLKTLEEPPEKVIFLFATTEPHKVLPTILSRCQRFNLNRIPIDRMTAKLKRIAQEMNIQVEDEALYLLAQRADGGLRDAESLFDQIIAFHDGNISAKTVADVLGIMSKETFFTLDQAGKEGRLAAAFEIAHDIFSQGKDIIHFVECLTEHFRNILLIKLAGPNAPFLSLSESDKERYIVSTKCYSQEQCQTILDFLIEEQNHIRFQPSIRIALETILLRVMRTHQRIPIEFLVKRLNELEQVNGATPQQHPIPEQPPTPPHFIPERLPTPTPPPPAPPQAAKPSAPPIQEIKSLGSTSEDPTPSPEDLGIKVKKPVAPPSPPPSPAPQPQQPIEIDKQRRYDTILQFAAVELEGTIQKKPFIGK